MADLHAGLNVGYSGSHPGKVCLISLTPSAEPIIIAALDPAHARALGFAMAAVAGREILELEYPGPIQPVVPYD